MPIEIPPALESASEDFLARLQDEADQYAQAVARKQGQIAGTSGQPPGLQASEDLNAALYSQLESLISPFEIERRAIDGQYVNTPVTEADITAAATSRSGVLFPPSNTGLSPTRLPQLDGDGGADTSNENLAIFGEGAALDILIELLEADRAADASYATWVAALGTEKSALNSQAAALAMNEQYGAGHQAYLDVQTELAIVNALLPSPPVTDAAIILRRIQIVTRTAQLTARIADIAAKAGALYDQRYLVLQGRVHLVLGTLARLISAQSGIEKIQAIQAINSDLLALYNQLV